MSLTHKWKVLFQQILRAKKPDGLLNWRFFCINPSNAIRIHKKIFLKSFFSPPMVRSILLNVWKCVCWYGFYAGWYTLKSFKHHARKIKKTEHIGYFKQLFCLIRFTFGYNLLPHYIYRYQFYLPNKKATPFHYFYAFEQPILHDLINAHDYPNFREAKAFVGDKLRFSERLKLLNIPCVETKSLENQIEYSDINTLFVKKDLFIKPNKASSSRDAFQLKYDIATGHYEIHPIHGETVKRPDLVRLNLSGVLKRKDMVVQSFLTDHPEIALISGQAQITTFRVITVKSPRQMARTLYLQIEIPDKRHTKKQYQIYKIYPLDLKSFSIDSVFQEKQKESVERVQFSTELIKMLRQGLNDCERVHDQCIDLCSVGFDFVITSSGPVILEANYNWNIDLLYCVLRDEDLLSSKNHPAMIWLNEAIIDI